MRWVHMECLESWRKMSVNPKSFYECEQCKFQYKFGASNANNFLIARLLASDITVAVLSFVMLLALIFVGGFVGKAFDQDSEWADVFNIWKSFSLHHLITGATTTGLLSVLGWATSIGGIGGGGGWRVILGNGWNDAGRDTVSTVIVVLAVLAGLAFAFRWIYDRLFEYARKTTRMAQSIVLDVQGAQDGGADAQADGAAAAAGQAGEEHDANRADTRQARARARSPARAAAAAAEHEPDVRARARRFVPVD